MRTSSAVAGTLTLLGLSVSAGTASADSPGILASTDTPVESYRKFSVGLTSSADMFAASPLTGFYAGNSPVGLPGANRTSVYGLVGLGANLRVVYDGFTLGLQLNVFFNDAGIFAGAANNPTVLVPGVTFGYAIGLTDRFALTPMARASFFIPAGNNSSVDTQLTGEAGLSYFFGKNGYIEPYFGLGMLDVPAGGNVYFLLDFGYRLGIVF